MKFFVDARRACRIAFVVMFPAVSACVAMAADVRFPFDKELLLDTAPIRPSKRVPMLTVAPDGNATIDLWCKSVSAQVQLDDKTITITPGELPAELPAMMSQGQCNEARMRADETMLAALSQVTAWRREGNAVLLAGGKSLRFFPAAN